MLIIKKICSTVKSTFSDKSKAINTIALYEKGRITRQYLQFQAYILQAWQSLLNLKNVHRERPQNFWIHLQRKSTKATLSKNLSLFVKFVNQNYRKIKPLCLKIAESEISKTRLTSTLTANSCLQKLRKKREVPRHSEIYWHYTSFFKKWRNW